MPERQICSLLLKLQIDRPVHLRMHSVRSKFHEKIRVLLRHRSPQPQKSVTEFCPCWLSNAWSSGICHKMLLIGFSTATPIRSLIQVRMTVSVNLTSLLLMSTTCCSACARSSKPQGSAVLRNGGGGPGRFRGPRRALEKVEHGVPSHTALTRPLRKALSNLRCHLRCVKSWPVRMSQLTASHPCRCMTFVSRPQPAKSSKN